MTDSVSTDAERRALMVGLILGGVVSQAVCAAVELGVPEALADGPQDIEALAGICGADRRSLARLVRALASVGVFARVSDRDYALTALGETLLVREADGRSLAGMARFAGSGWLAGARAALAESVRTGQSAFRRAHGLDLYEAMQDHPDLAALYEGWAGYGSGEDALAAAVLGSYDFSGSGVVVDVGGRYGALLGRILASTPGVTGILFDLPDVEERAQLLLRTQGVEDRCEIVTGSFFDAVPEGGDLYLLSNVLSDWSDERAVRLLRNCRAAISPGGRLLTIEPVFGPEVLASRGVSMLDLWMMVHSGGMRTEDELRDLISAAELHVQRVIPTASGAATVIEAAPA